MCGAIQVQPYVWFLYGTTGMNKDAYYKKDVFDSIKNVRKEPKFIKFISL
jgi:hypothetical protein